MKRVEANDHVALRQMGCIHSVVGNSKKAFEYLSKAAGIGDADGHHCLSTMYVSEPERGGRCGEGHEKGRISCRGSGD